jgi:hypothetical protein
MRHLAHNFKKKFKGKVYDENLWLELYTCNKRKHEHYLRVLYAENPLVKQYMDAEENAATLKIEANEAVPASWYEFAFIECRYPFVCICSLFYLWLIILFIISREKIPRDEETKETEVEPSYDALEFVANAFDGFEAIREEEEG